MQQESSGCIVLRNGKEEIISEKKISQHLAPHIAEMEEGRKKQALRILTPDAPHVFEQLKTCYDRFIVAAGGLVKNESGELLLIFRNGKWDLPKGKLEKNEQTAVAAVREVREETGLQQVELLREYARTYHTYTQGGKHILKETAWFLMQGKRGATIPQTEEGITRIAWVAARDAQEVFTNTHDNILVLMKSFFATA